MDSPPDSVPDGGVVPNPNALHFAAVAAAGSGCPAGTWDAAISPDGRAFTITFSAYEARVEPGAAIAVKGCTVSFDLEGPTDFSWAIPSARYDGVAFLDSAGMSAHRSATYSFQGTPLENVMSGSRLTGPVDTTFADEDEFTLADVVWSPCGSKRRVLVRTRLEVTNNEAKTGQGHVTLSAVGSVLEVPLLTRPCTL